MHMTPLQLAFIFPAGQDVPRLLRAALASFIARGGLTSGAEAVCEIKQM